MSEKNIADTAPDEFWRIVEEARHDAKRFRDRLRTMDRDQIARFYWTYEELANRLRTDRYWPYVDPDLSEDGLAELANWVVAQGKAHYREILAHPDRIPPKKNDPGLLSDVIEEHEERFNDDIPINTHGWDDDWKQKGKESPWT